jgi:hypothetical protein
LIARAQSNLDVPIPVLLSLSSWKEHSQPIARWMETELNLKYGVRKDIGRQWINEGSLLPLLDGLDELEPQHQGKCVVAINRFRHEHKPEHLVVCSRLDEYQNSRAKLELNGAVFLQPLTDEQICHYLVSAKHPELWKNMQTDMDLADLARTPLLLRMAALTYETRPIPKWKDCGITHEHPRFLFDVYIERMLSREINGPKYTKKRTLHWLAWLANQLKEKAHNNFLIERLQPTCLQSRVQRWLYRIAVIVPVVFAFAIFHVLISFLGVIPEGHLVLAVMEKLREITGGDLFDGAYLAAIGGLITGFIIGLMRTIRPIETLQWSAKKAWRGMVLGLRRWLIAGVSYGGCIGLIAGQIGWSICYLFLYIRISNAGLAVWSRLGQIAGAISGLIAVVAVVLIVRPGVWRNHGFRDWTAAMWTDSIISAIIWGPAAWLSFGLYGLVGGFGIGIIAGLSHWIHDRPAFRMAEALVVGVVGPP